jgi:hypothetical protein
LKIIKLASVLVVVGLVGCAGLNVTWVATATYNTPATTSATMLPGVAIPATVSAALLTPQTTVTK